MEAFNMEAFNVLDEIISDWQKDPQRYDWLGAMQVTEMWKMLVAFERIDDMLEAYFKDHLIQLDD